MSRETLRFSIFLFFALAASGCGITPYAPDSSTPILAIGLSPSAALQTAKINLPVEQETISPACPGQGSAACEINWRYLQEGVTAAEVVAWLGHPQQQAGPDIYVDKVVAQWQYEHNGIVHFENDQLRYVDMPASFVYPLQEAGS